MGEIIDDLKRSLRTVREVWQSELIGGLATHPTDLIMNLNHIRSFRT